MEYFYFDATLRVMVPVRILDPTCVVNHVKIHEQSGQVIKQNQKSNLMKTDTTDTTYMKWWINYKNIEFGTTFKAISPRLTKMGYWAESYDCLKLESSSRKNKWKLCINVNFKHQFRVQICPDAYSTWKNSIGTCSQYLCLWAIIGLACIREREKNLHESILGGKEHMWC